MSTESESLEQKVFAALEDFRDGTLGDERLAELRALLASSPEARRVFVEQGLASHLLASALLPSSMNREPSPLPAVERKADASSPQSFRLSKLGASVKLVLAVLLLVGLLGVCRGVWWFVRPARIASPSPVATSGEGSIGHPLAVRPGSSDPPVAVLVKEEDARWLGDSLSGVAGVPLRTGWLTLESGSATIRFNCGAVVTLSGPAQLQLVDSRKAFLMAGNLVATVPPEAIGFQVDTSVMHLTDQGTEFSVTVDAQGETEVHVLRGWVAIDCEGGDAESETIELRKDQARRFQADGSSSELDVDHRLSEKIVASRPSQRIGYYTFDSYRASSASRWLTNSNPRVVGGSDVQFGPFVFKGVKPGPTEYPENLNRWSFKEWRPEYRPDEFFVGFQVEAEPGHTIRPQCLSLEILRSGGNLHPELAPKDGVVRVSSDQFKTYREFELMHDELLVLAPKRVSVDLSSLPAASSYAFRFLFKGESVARAIRLDEVTLEVDAVPSPMPSSQP